MLYLIIKLISKKQLFPSISIPFSHNTWIFLQDSAPSHGSSMLKRQNGHLLLRIVILRFTIFGTRSRQKYIAVDCTTHGEKNGEELKDKIKTVWKDRAIVLPEILKVWPA